MLYLPTLKASDLVLRFEDDNLNSHIPYFYLSARKFLFNEKKNKIREKWVEFVHYWQQEVRKQQYIL